MTQAEQCKQVADATGRSVALVYNAEFNLRRPGCIEDVDDGAMKFYHFRDGSKLGTRWLRDERGSKVFDCWAQA